jgi:hypothetical protein
MAASHQSTHTTGSFGLFAGSYEVAVQATGSALRSTRGW